MKWNETNSSQPVELPYYPNRSGVYIITDAQGEVLYVGESIQLSRRASHLTAMQKDKTNKAGLSHIKAGHVRSAQNAGKTLHIRFIETADHKRVEKDLRKKYSPPWNMK